MCAKAERSTLDDLLWRIAKWAPFGATIIDTGNKEDPYLLRVYLTPERERLTEYFGTKLSNALPRVYLHRFFRGDEDRAVHSHPWRHAVSLILTGGYEEFRWMPLTREFEVRHLTPGKINYIRRNDYHRVELYAKQGCWTLFLSMGRVMESNGKDWNFLNTDTGVTIPWGDWTQD